MKIALVNPSWNFDHSIYFGCREPHLPLELGYAKSLLEQNGHQIRMFDGHLFAQPNDLLAWQVTDFGPDMTVLTTAPSYLFWRCAQPELRVPREFLIGLAGRGGRTIAIGPHGSVTPKATLSKLGCDIVVRGEAEEALVELAAGVDLDSVKGIAFTRAGQTIVTGEPRAARFTDAPALVWPHEWIARHHHHHHRFGTEAIGLGAEVESSRGCPYNCSFCAKIDFRDKYRRRNLAPMLNEVDRLISQGVQYVYFIDEIFLPNRPLLEALIERPIKFGIQTRIDLWKPDMLALLGDAGCVSIEAGVESLTEDGRAALDKNCRLSTQELADRLILARRHVPFVQANLINADENSKELVDTWRETLQGAGVWANDPVPLYAYPSSPDYRKRYGAPDDLAWERSHEDYLHQFAHFSDIQDEQPRPLQELEISCVRP